MVYITLLESPAFHCLDPFNSVPKVSDSSSVVTSVTKDNDSAGCIARTCFHVVYVVLVVCWFFFFFKLLDG